MVLKITRISKIQIGMDLNRNYLWNISMIGFRITNIVMEIWKIYFISLFPIRYLLISEFDIEYKPIHFLFRDLYLISNWILGLSLMVSLIILFLNLMELRQLESDWRLVKLNGFLGIDLMLVSAFGVNTQGIAHLLIYG